ncbi:MAG: transglutaminase-like domain-containing protein [Spongiibacteraceae bacterium]
MQNMIQCRLPQFLLAIALSTPFAAQPLLAQEGKRADNARNIPKTQASAPSKPPDTTIKLRDPNDPREGDIQVVGDQQIIKATTLQQELAALESHSKTVTLHTKKDNKLLAVAAPSANRSLHFPSAYLLGRTPYKVTERWMPLYVISERIHYQLDDEQFPGREEVWLTTMQTWKKAHGDCEDHAILLADWLIEMGLDARVVLGTHGDNGHAWVIVFHDGDEYLLEATRKRFLERWASYSLASMLPQYHPEMMFNRDDLWVNSGSKLTTSYSGKQWKKALHFSPDAQDGTSRANLTTR